MQEGGAGGIASVEVVAVAHDGVDELDRGGEATPKAQEPVQGGGPFAVAGVDVDSVGAADARRREQGVVVDAPGVAQGRRAGGVGVARIGAEVEEGGDARGAAFPGLELGLKGGCGGRPPLVGDGVDRTSTGSP